MPDKKTNYILVSSIFASYVLTYFVKVYVNKEWTLERFTEYVIETSSVIHPRNILGMLKIYLSVSNTWKLFDLMAHALADDLLNELDKAQADSPNED